MRLLVPAYGYPAIERALWDGIADARPWIGHVIVNPGSGPGAVRDPVWVEQVRRLEGLGIGMLGYLDLAYAGKPHTAILAEARTWRRWYGIGNYFLDCATSADVRHTQEVADVLRNAVAFARLTANPGTRASAQVARHFDCVVEHEGRATTVPLPASAAPLAAPHREGPQRAWIIHSAPRGQAGPALARAQRSGIAELWITDLRGPNPYRALPGYWAWLVANLEQPVERSGERPSRRA
jgi:hypothetical protein